MIRLLLNLTIMNVVSKCKLFEENLLIHFQIRDNSMLQ